MSEIKCIVPNGNANRHMPATIGYGYIHFFYHLNNVVKIGDNIAHLQSVYPIQSAAHCSHEQ